MSSELPPLVLHLDVDAFFVQAEQLRNPDLQGKPVAIQQHQDIIAANAAAKASGVTKHMQPSEARRLLRAVGGTVAHVYLAPGGRVSYQPYRELSARMIRVLRGLPWVAVLEKASIDEAYLCVPAAGDSFQAAAARHAGPFSGSSTTPQVALQRAREAKAAVQQQLGLCVSVGVAPNRLLAKLASAAAKPDGVFLVADQQAALRLLSETPASRLPGYGGKTAEAFERHGIRAASDLQRYSQLELEQLLGLKAAAAAQLAQWCRGVDSTPVQERGPPKTLSVQMSLSPQLLRMHPSLSDAMPVGGGKAGVLQPLVVGQPDFRPRIRQLMEAMGLDLLQRVREDSAEEAGRWPRTLTVSMRAFGGGRDQAFTSRSASFPACTLDQQSRRQYPAQVEQPEEEQQQMGPLEQVVVRGLEAAAHQVAAAYPASATVVELRLAATSFESAAAAAAAAPITRFFSPAKPAQQEARQQAQQAGQPQLQQHETSAQPPAPPQPPQLQQQQQQQQQQQEQQQQQQQLQATSNGGLGADQQGDGQAPSQVVCESAESYQLALHAAVPPAQLSEPARQVVANGSFAGQRGEKRRESRDVDLGSVDVGEQERILLDLRRQQSAQQNKTRASGGRLGLASSKRQRKQGCPAAAEGTSQPKISAFLRRQQ